ncbi:CBS domain-containing protein [Patescibacteria group bacterium]|nr:MAG: CBS domain-containing protein [Patescibacteria group bacterium]
MFTFLLILTIVCFILLVLVAGMHPTFSSLSHYELIRRADAHDHRAAQLVHKELLLQDVISNLKITTGFLLVGLCFLLVATFGTVLGTILIIIVLFEYGALARLSMIQKISRRFYELLEPKLLAVAAKTAPLMKFIRADVGPRPAFHLGSRQELEHLIDQSEGVLTAEDKKLVVHSLAFGDTLVSHIMTAVGDIASIKKTEFLGPLTLDDLHKTGHSRLPVIGADIDHVVGVLYLENLLTLDIKRSVTAEKAMDPHVFYIHQDQTLTHALAAMLRTHRHLFIVIDSFRRTVGVVTLNDVIEALIGRKIVDEFDGHESIRAVSERSTHEKHPEV